MSSLRQEVQPDGHIADSCSELEQPEILDESQTLDQEHMYLGVQFDNRQLPHSGANLPLFDYDYAVNHVSRSPIIKLESFDGNSDWETFFAHFNICAEIGNWGQRTRTLALQACMYGEARVFLLCLTDEERSSYSILVDKFNNRFVYAKNESIMGSDYENKVLKDSTFETVVMGTERLIADEFSSIYECEWSRARDSLMATRHEEEVIYILMRIVRSGYDRCLDVARAGNHSITDAELTQYYIEHDLPKGFDRAHLTTELLTFVRITLSVLLKLCFHNPPLSIQWLPKGETIDSEIFTGANEHDHVVDWTIWPAVLSNGGDVLRKGVVVPIV